MIFEGAPLSDDHPSDNVPHNATVRTVWQDNPALRRGVDRPGTHSVVHDGYFDREKRNGPGSSLFHRSGYRFGVRRCRSVAIFVGRLGTLRRIAHYRSLFLGTCRVRGDFSVRALDDVEATRGGVSASDG